MSVVVKALTQYEIVGGEVVEKPDHGRGPHGELPKMIIQSPAYNCFFSTAKNTLCELSINKLIYDTEGDQATWYIDFEDLERRAADPMAKHIGMTSSSIGPTGLSASHFTQLVPRLWVSSSKLYFPIINEYFPSITSLAIFSYPP